MYYVVHYISTRRLHSIIAPFHTHTDHSHPPLTSLPLLSIHPLLPKQHMYDVTSSAASLITQKISINHTHTHTHTHTYTHQHEYTHEMKHTHTYSNEHIYTISLIHSDILLNSFCCQLQSLIIFNH